MVAYIGSSVAAEGTRAGIESVIGEGCSDRNRNLTEAVPETKNAPTSGAFIVLDRRAETEYRVTPS
jgi:hypothetical protein